MSEEQANIAQHTLALLRKMDTKLDEVLLRLSILERRGALKDEEATLDRLAMVELRQRIERIERRLDLAN
ncbi:MAG: hypothetical protein K2X11_08145 [Acetobacteraceae bacterium]|nr:hypothetical protein [Acetobacteraceae bacterium]